MARRRLATLGFTLVLFACPGCGSGEEGDGFPPVAEPAEAPALDVRPEGKVVEVGSGSEGLVVDATTGLAALGVREPPSLELIDLVSLEVERTVPLNGHPRHLQLAAPGGPVLVPAEDADELVRVDLPSGATSAVGVGDFPHDAAAIDGRVFVGNEMGDTISVLDGDETVATLDAPVQPGGIVASAGVVGVIAVAERVLAVYGPRSLEELGSTDVGEGPTHIVAAGKRAFVTDTQGDAILEFELDATPKLVSRTPLEGTPYGIAIDPERDRLWVTLTSRNEVAELTIGKGPLEEIARYPTVQQPNTVAVDPKTGAVLVAGATEEGTLQRIEASGH
jgi:DNA-binding beta-propeller fold protein YncE